MKNFNYVLKESLDFLSNEGGNAFEDVFSIKKEFIDKTISDFKDKVLYKFLNNNELFLIGSTGKKPESGDIDIALDVSKSTESILVLLMKIDQECAQQHIPAYINTITFNMLHIKFPQYGDNKYVQIDLLLTKDPEFTKFFMFSPDKSMSKYKGAHRNILLHSILFEATKSNEQYNEHNELIKWNQIDINAFGIFRQSKTLVDKFGNKLKYKNTNEDLELDYAKVNYEFKISNDVNFAILMLFGKDFNVNDIDTFEKIYDIISNNDKFRYSNIKYKILKNAYIKFKESKNLVFPDELKKI